MTSARVRTSDAWFALCTFCTIACDDLLSADVGNDQAQPSPPSAHDDDPSDRDAGVDVGVDAVPRTCPGRAVHFVYLVPSDREIVPAFAEALRVGTVEAQAYLQNQLGNDFTVCVEPIAVYRTPHRAAWYGENPSPRGAPGWNFWDNTLADGFALTGGRYDDPDNIWMYYVDAEQPDGQGIGAYHHLSVQAALMLNGLAGQHPNPVCEFVGGLTHELVHTFGLPHSPGCDENQPPCTGYELMSAGYRLFPSSYLLDHEKTFLAQTGFFSPSTIPAPVPDCHQR
jgi:hypothetical protein